MTHGNDQLHLCVGFGVQLLFPSSTCHGPKVNPRLVDAMQSFAKVRIFEHWTWRAVQRNVLPLENHAQHLEHAAGPLITSVH